MKSLSREWAGDTCAVLASGPSMSQQVADIVRASGCRTIAVNNQGIAFGGKPALAPWADILYASDARWWYNYKNEIAEFKGRKFTVCNVGSMTAHAITEDITAMGNGGTHGFDDRPTHLRTGHNSGYAAIHLAIHLGATRIVLCGFDMHSRHGEHWFGDHFWRRSYRSRYDLFVNAFKKSAAELMARAEIINCTPGSALKCFPSMELQEALDGMPIVRKSETSSAATAKTALGSVGSEAAGAA